MQSCLEEHQEFGVQLPREALPVFPLCVRDVQLSKIGRLALSGKRDPKRW